MAVVGAMADLDRAYVDSGSDIALHGVAERSFVIGMIDRPDSPNLFGHVRYGDAIALTDGGRPLPRVGGLAVGEIKGEDGLR